MPSHFEAEIEREFPGAKVLVKPQRFAFHWNDLLVESHVTSHGVWTIEVKDTLNNRSRSGQTVLRNNVVWILRALIDQLQLDRKADERT